MSIQNIVVIQRKFLKMLDSSNGLTFEVVVKELADMYNMSFDQIESIVC